MPPLGRTYMKGYKLSGSVRSSQSMYFAYPPAGGGRISTEGVGALLEPTSPPMTRTEPFAMTMADGYQRPSSRVTSLTFSCQSLVPQTPSDPSGQYRRTP